MADIQIDEEKQYQSSYQAEQKPLFVRLILLTGIVSTEKAAEYMLLGIAVLLILLSIIIFSTGNGTQQTSQMYLDRGRTVDQSQFTNFQ